MSRSVRHRWRPLLSAAPAIAWLAIILGASAFSHPSQVIPDGVQVWDKALHAAVYAVFGFLVCFGLDHGLRWRADLLSLVAMTTLLAFTAGCFDEFVQWHRVSRTAEWGDVAADTFGGFVGGLAWVAARTGWVRVRGGLQPPPDDALACSSSASQRA